MAPRKRYDTDALVDQLRSERRTGILLIVAGVAVLGFIITLYGLFIGGEEEVPEVPANAMAAADAAPKDDAKAKKEAEEKAKKEAKKEAEEKAKKEAEETAKKPVSVQISVKGKSTLWLDGKKLGKIKKKKPATVELIPGEHELKAKVGRKTITEKFTVTAGEKLKIAVDAKKKKIVVKKAGGT